MNNELIENLISELAKLHHKNELAKTVGPDYFEPGMMEYLDQYDGSYNEVSGEIIIRFEAKGTRYEGRTEQIEKVKAGDEIYVKRETGNQFNSNNFTLVTIKGHNVGNLPAELCNAMSPLYDAGELVIEEAFVSFVEPLSKRNRHAKQAVLFVELHCRLQQNIF